MLIHITNDAGILLGTHLYTWVESSNVDKISCCRTKVPGIDRNQPATLWSIIPQHFQKYRINLLFYIWSHSFIAYRSCWWHQCLWKSSTSAAVGAPRTQPTSATTSNTRRVSSTSWSARRGRTRSWRSAGPGRPRLTAPTQSTTAPCWSRRPFAPPRLWQESTSAPVLSGK